MRGLLARNRRRSGVAELFEFLHRRRVVVAFSRAGVETVGDLVAVSLGEVGHRHALRQVLANEAVGIFVRAPLPGMVMGSGLRLPGGARREPAFRAGLAVKFLVSRLAR